MKRKKQLLAYLLCFAMVVNSVPLSVSAEEITTKEFTVEDEMKYAASASEEEVEATTANIIAEGTCGENLSWIFDEEGSLTVSGEGEMSEYDMLDEYPWSNYRLDITKIVIKEGITNIAKNAFSNYYNVTSVELPAGLKIISDGAFSDDHTLKEINFPDGLETICYGAFMACPELTEIDLPDTLQTIGAYAFDRTGLTDLYIPASVTEIGLNPFMETKIQSVVIDENNTAYYSEGAAIYTKDGVRLQAYVGAPQEEGFSIPHHVTSIAASAFCNNTNLKSIIIPGSVRNIEDSAFSCCKQLEEVTFKGDAPILSNNIFAEVAVTVNYPKDNSTWTEEVRQQYGGTITWVSYEVDEANASIIDEGIYESTITWKVSENYVLTLSGSGEIKGITEADVKYPWESYSDNICKIVIEEGITNVPASAFDYFYALKEVQLAETVKIIDQNAFNSCTELRTINIPANLEMIGDSVFSSCFELAEIILPETLKIIGSGAFSSTGLKKIHIPDSIESLGAGIFSRTCLDSITISENNPYYYVEDMVIYTKDGKTLHTYLDNVTGGNYNIQTGIETIGENAFAWNETVECITIPDTVTKIEEAAFANAVKLTSLVFKGDAPSMGWLTFMSIKVDAYYPEGNVTWETAITKKYQGEVTWIPTEISEDIKVIAEGICGENQTWILDEYGTLTISGEGEMSDYTDVSQVPWSEYRTEILRIVLESGVTNIGENAFFECSNLAAIELPNSLISIGLSAFNSCTSLTAIELPDSLTSIGDVAFANTGLTSIHIPATTTHIGMGVFILTDIQNITIEEDNPAYYVEDMIIFTKDGTSLHTYVGEESVTDYTIPDGVTTIKAAAFSYNDELQNINVPASVKIIEQSAFYMSDSIDTIRFDGDAPEIGEDIFGEVTATVFYQEGNTTWTNVANQNYGGIITWETYKVEGITAFGACGENLTWVLDDYGVLTISGEGEMGAWTQVSEIPWCGYEQAIVKVVLKNGVTNIANLSFANCGNMINIEIPGTVETIGTEAFGGCASLRTITIPEGVKGIEMGAFVLCQNLTDVLLPSTLEYIGNAAFIMTQVKSIHIPKSVKEMQEGALFTTSLETITIDENNTAYYVEDSVLFTKDGSMLHTYPGHKAGAEYVIPDGVSKIETFAFYGSQNLESVVMPASVTEIGMDVFYENIKLKSVTFEGDAPAFSETTFGGVTLNVYYAADNTTWTEEKKQQYNGTITWIPYYIDENGEMLLAKGSCGDNLVWELTAEGVLTISGKGSMTTAPWSEYNGQVTKIIIEDGVTNILNSAFVGFTALQTVEIADSVITIEDGAFAECTSLKEVTLSGNLQSIGMHAFFANESLSNIILPESLVSLGHVVFGLTDIREIYIPASTTEIGWGTFATQNLQTITIADENPNYYVDNNIIYTKDGTCLHTYASGKPETSYEIPEGITEINGLAFVETQNLQHITVPASVTTVLDEAFELCNALVDVTFEGNAPTFGNLCFANTTATVYYPSGNTTWTEEVREQHGGTLTWEPYKVDGITASGICGENLTWILDDYGVLTISGTGDMPDWANASETPWNAYATNVTKVVIEESVTSIGSYAFAQCTNLTYAQMADSITKIGEGAFLETGLMGVISLPANLEVIGTLAFAMCMNITEVILPEALITIGDMAFAYTGIKEIHIPAATTSIGMVPFVTSKVESISVAEDNPVFIAIDGALFTKEDKKLVTYPACKNGTDYIIPNGTEIVAYGAFGGVQYLESITIPTTVTTLEGYLFGDSVAINSLKFEGAVPSIASDSFGAITANVYYPSEDESWTEEVMQQYGGTIIWMPYVVDENGDEFIAQGICGENLTWKLTIEGVLTISGEGEMNQWTQPEEIPWFAYHLDIKHVIIEEGVTNIWDGSFCQCNNLKTISIPQTVKTIGVQAFIECTELTSVILPDGLTSIGIGAFVLCKSLKEIEIPLGIKEIAPATFGECTALTSVSLPEGLTTIGEQAFAACSALKEVNMPETLTSVGTIAFLYTAIEEIHIPAATTQLSDAAFTVTKLKKITVAEENEAYCAKDNVLFSKDGTVLHTYAPYKEDISYVIPKGVTEINYGAFGGCQYLEKVTVPSTMTTLENNIFGESVSVNTVLFTGDAPTMAENCLVSVSGTVYYPSGNGTWTEEVMQQYGGTVTWQEAEVSEEGELLYAQGTCGENLTWKLTQEGVLTISGEGAMTDWQDAVDSPWYNQRAEIKKVIIEEGVTTVSSRAFFDSYNLTEVMIADTVTIIGSSSFETCDSLVSVKLPDNLEVIGDAAFALCEALTEINIPDGTVEIGMYTFAECYALAIASLPSDLVSIGEGAFLACTSLENISLPETLVYVGPAAFIGSGLKEIYIPEKTVELCEYAFASTKIENITVADENEAYYVEDNVIFTKDGKGLYLYAPGKMDSYYSIPEGVQTVMNAAFGGAYNIETLEIPTTVNSIGIEAFAACSKLNDVWFKGSAPKIGENCFVETAVTVHYPEYDVSWIEEVMQQYSGTVTWEPYSEDGVIAAGKCGDNVSWRLEDSGYFKVYGTGDMSWEDVPWAEYKQEITDVTIEDGVTNIGKNAFAGCVNLNYVNIADSVVTIEDEAFVGCSSLWHIWLPGNVQTIGQGAFYLCRELTDISLPESVVSIGKLAFGETGVMNLYIPAATTQLDEYALVNKRMTWIDVSEENSVYCSKDGVVFTKDGKTLLVVPGSKETESYRIPTEVETIAAGAFVENQTIKAVSIPSSVTVLENQVFGKCSVMEEISFRGDAPVFADNVFEEITVTVYYPSDNDTWTDELLQQYGGTITWEAYDAPAEGLIASGKCGDNLTWELSEEEVLTISGEGAMYNYQLDDNKAPWRKYSEYINTLVVGDGVTVIGDYAFAECGSLRNVNLPNSLVRIGEKAFYNGRLWEITIPASVTEFGPHVFAGCPLLSEVYMLGDAPEIELLEGESTPSLGEGFASEWGSTIYRQKDAKGYDQKPWTDYEVVYVDADGNLLKEGYCGKDVYWTLDAEGTLTITGTGEITKSPWEEYRSEIINVVIGEGVTAVRGLSYCPNMVRVQIPSTVERIDRIYSTKLEEIQVDGYNQFYTDIEGVLFTKDKTTLICYPNMKSSEYVIPSTVTLLGEQAFSGCDNLKAITIPDSVVDMQESVFSNCTSLVEVVLPKNLEYVGGFAGCTSLEKVVLPENVKYICESAFQNCTSLKEITFPKSLETIEYAAFAYNTSLGKITFEGNAPDIVYAFEEVTATVYYPAESTTWNEEVMQNYGGTLTWVAYEGPKTVATGWSGDTTWVLREDGVITFSGSGNMKNYGTKTEVPWNEYLDQITTVVINDGVRSIAPYAFYGATNLINVEIADTVTAIGRYSFYKCSGVKEVELPEGLETIGESAFFNTALTKATLPEGLKTLSPYTFRGCAELTEVTLGSSLQIISESAFNGTAIKMIVIPDSVTSIGAYAFKNCTKLSSVLLPKGLEVIGAGAFQSTALTEVEVPKTVTSVGDYTFASCQSLGTVKFMGKAPTFGEEEEEAENVFKDVTATVYYPAFDATWENVITHQYNGIITWEAYDNREILAEGYSGSNVTWKLMEDGMITFSGNGNMKNYGTKTEMSWYEYMDQITVVVIEEGVTSIGECAFFGAANLVNVEIADTVEVIGDYAFKNAEKMEGINIPLGLEKIGAGAFQGCKALTDFTIPENVIEIKDYAFADCGEMGIITVTGDAPKIWAKAFSNTKVTISYPEGNLTWNEDTMQQYSGTITWEAYENREIVAKGYSGNTTWKLTEDGMITFAKEDGKENGAMKNYKTKTEMPWYKYREQIKSVKVKEGVTSISSYGFYEMPKLETVKMADSVTHIGDYAFKNVAALKEVELSENLDQLGESAFYGCSALTAVEIPASLWTIKAYTFKKCSALTSVIFHEGNLMKISDGAFSGTGLTEVQLPDCMTILDSYVFKDCTKLTKVTLGSGIGNGEKASGIRESVFYGTALTSIVIPEGVTSIGAYAFKGCTELTEVVLPESLKIISDSAFNTCTALTSIEIPEEVTDIDSYAFKNCTKLREVVLPDELSTITEGAFSGCTALTSIVIPEGVTSIGAYVFKGCTELTEVGLSDSLRTIGESAFNSCTSLKKMVFPAAVNEIGDYCFSGSYNLWHLTFLGDAPTIGTGAFKGMAATVYYPADNTTWTADRMQNYGGNITWKAN